MTIHADWLKTVTGTASSDFDLLWQLFCIQPDLERVTVVQGLFQRQSRDAPLFAREDPAARKLLLSGNRQLQRIFAWRHLRPALGGQTHTLPDHVDAQSAGLTANLAAAAARYQFFIDLIDYERAINDILANGMPEIFADHIRTALERSKSRAGLPARRFSRLVAEGTLRIQVSGEVFNFMARFDAWILPFLNIYIMAGSTNDAITTN